ncbi:MAG: amidohydrolase family protein [Planctomycetes bacterium]|nr:amidohydrolase family protein [Planctomycetota bacterium]
MSSGGATARAPRAGGGDLLLRNARCWPELERGLEVRIAGGRIVELARDQAPLSPRGGSEQVLDARGLCAIPGLLDCHVHFRDPGLAHKEGWETGSHGALHGGVTAVVEVQNNPPLSTSRAVLEARIAHVRSLARVDFGCLANLLPDSLPELAAMAPLTPAYKLFLGGSTGLGGVLDREVLRTLIRAAATAGRRIVGHCEDEELLRAGKQRHPDATAAEHHLVRSAEAEVESIRTALEFTAECGGELHVFHISTAAGVELVRAARARGVRVRASTAPHYVLLSCADAPALGNLLKVNPSIKTRADADGILLGLRDGTVDAIGTDHAPHPLDEKRRAYAHAPSGMPSVDLLWPLVLELVERGWLDAQTALASVTERAAASVGVQHKRGLQLDSDGDLVLFDPRERRVVKGSELPSKSKWSAYEGWSLPGWPRQVVRRGQLVFAQGRALGAAGGEQLHVDAPRPRADLATRALPDLRGARGVQPDACCG